MIGTAEELTAYLRGDPEARRQVERPEDGGQTFLQFMESQRPKPIPPVEPAQEKDK